MSDKKKAIADHKAAKQKLADVTDADQAAGRNWETDEYLAANQAVIDAEKHVPWWRR